MLLWAGSNDAQTDMYATQTFNILLPLTFKYVYSATAACGTPLATCDITHN